MTVRRVVAAVVAVVVAVAAVAALRAVVGRNRPHRAAPGRTGPQRVPHGWCEICGDELWGDDLHEVVDGSVDGDGVLSAGELAGGGTAMAAEYCAAHCPGGCRHHHVA